MTTGPDPALLTDEQIIAGLRAEVEQLTVQLAGCAVAATDASAQQEAMPGSYGWSPAYADVLRLCRAHRRMRAHISELLTAEIERLQKNGPDTEPTSALRRVLASFPTPTPPAIPQHEWRWFGSAGHLIIAAQCRYHLRTEIGSYVISTVGEYVPSRDAMVSLARVRNKPLPADARGDRIESEWLERFGFEEIGAGRKYETMVFVLGPTTCTATMWDDKPCDCGQHEVASWTELYVGHGNTRGEARKSHMELCEKMARLAADPELACSTCHWPTTEREWRPESLGACTACAPQVAAD